MAAQNGPDVGIAQHPGQCRLVPQLHQDGEVQDRRYRRVMQCQNGSVRGGGSEFSREPLQLVRAQLTVVETRDRGVESDDPQPVDEIRMVHGGVVGGQVEGVPRCGN